MAKWKYWCKERRERFRHKNITRGVLLQYVLQDCFSKQIEDDSRIPSFCGYPIKIFGGVGPRNSYTQSLWIDYQSHQPSVNMMTQTVSQLKSDDATYLSDSI